MEENGNDAIFNLDRVDDLPDSCKKELKLVNIRDEGMMLLGLFDIKNPLSFDEIIVGLYRLNKLEKTRTWVSATLYNLSKKGLVKKIKGKKGVYEKA
jgi:hypothetical protein